MAAITWSDVVTLAPELSTYPVAAQDFILDFVNNTLNVNVIDGEDGPRTKLVRIFLAAHIATMLIRANNNQTGAVTQESLGPQSTSYAQMSGVLSDRLNSTQYGIMYLKLINTSSARGPRVL